MSESMVERVAKAIGVPEQSGYVCEWSLQAARAAIKAMREPTDAMCEAADWQQQSDVNAYNWAIDAALSDK